MDETHNLSLPYLMPAYAQKHVVMNDALARLDAAVQLSVIDRNLTAPPGSPAEGDRYIVGAAATGAWSGLEGQIVALTDGAWLALEPRTGWLCWIIDEEVLAYWDGSAWQDVTAAFDAFLQGTLGATDNRLLRADGTDGKTAQGSAVTLDDSGNLSGIGAISTGAITSIGNMSVEAGSSAPITMTIPRANQFSSGLDIVKKGQTGNATGQVLNGAEIGYHSFYGWDGSAVRRVAFARVKAGEDISSGAHGGTYEIQTTTVGGTTSVARMIIGPGIQVGAPTGGDKGAGTLNATAVYDDNSLLTCMAMSREFIESGTVDLDYWDAQVPNLVVPEQVELVPQTYAVRVSRAERVVTADEDGRLIARIAEVEKVVEIPAFVADPIYDEFGAIVDAMEAPLYGEVVTPAREIVREHRTARIFKAMLEGGFDPRDPEAYFAKMRADEALPGMPTRADWQHNGLSIGEQFGRQWLAAEMLAIVANAMWAKLRDHEDRLVALEAA